MKMVRETKRARKDANEKWDNDLNSDSVVGKLDFLVREAKEAATKGKLFAFPARHELLK
jgi:hypothetical protein